MTTSKAKQHGLVYQLQQLGNRLSDMVMPNIGAFIAWGLITALFIPSGWLPNPELNQIVEPMQLFLLPLLIAYSGGKMIYGHRGAVVGTIAAMGGIVASSVPMFIGAMILGPLGGFLIKQFDERFGKKVPEALEVLVSNFSAGIIGFLLTIAGFYLIGPAIASLTAVFAAGVEAMIDRHLLALANVAIEPAKVLFLNSAINHGILTPLGIQQVTENGKSILFLLEINPGPGLGVLLAYLFYGHKEAKASAPGAILIHFIGGIHEIYFPYVLMKPLLFLAVISGGVSGTLVFQLMDAGLSGAAAPGSIIALLGMTAKGNHLAVVSGVLMSVLVSFLISRWLLKRDQSIKKTHI